MEKAEKLDVLRQVMNAMVEAVKACPDGAPGGILYAALMGYGCTLEQFEMLMTVLVEAKKVRKSGQLYFAV
jgi:hypothetical protein